MSTKSIKDKLFKSSPRDKEWEKEAKYRIQNEEDLDFAFSIAVKILSAMKNKGLSQKDLATLFNVSPQYISKLLKGKQNLSINTANKFGRLLGIKLLEVPKDYVVDVHNPVCNFTFWDDPIKVTQENEVLLNSYHNLSTGIFHTNKKWSQKKCSQLDC